MKNRHRHQRRTGNVLVFTTLMMVVLFAVVAFAVDLGYIHVVRTQLQASADATALAATWDLIDENVLTGNGDPLQTIQLARATADRYASCNLVAGVAPAIAYEDVEIGYLGNPWVPGAVMSFDDPSRFNTVRVRVRRTADQNGAISLFFAKVLGINTWGGQAEATALFLNNFNGFRIPPSGENLGILPLALDQETWNNMLAGIGDDGFGCTLNEDYQTWEVTEGPDGILEVNLFPEDTGAPGNRGTVDIGSNNNSTADIARQILHGLTSEDLEYHGGELAFDENGELLLNGDTGISAGVKDELVTLKGKTRIIPIFSQVSGNGNNAWYTIVQFAGVRIVEVKLTGEMSSKRVMLQPAIVDVCGAIPTSETNPKTYFIYSPVWLVQ